MLPYILNGTSKYLYHFQRVTMKCLKNKYTITFLYKIDGNALKMIHIMYFFLSECTVTCTLIHSILHRKWSCVEFCKNCLLYYATRYGNVLQMRWKNNEAYLIINKTLTVLKPLLSYFVTVEKTNVHSAKVERALRWQNV